MAISKHFFKITCDSFNFTIIKYIHETLLNRFEHLNKSSIQKKKSRQKVLLILTRNLPGFYKIYGHNFIINGMLFGQIFLCGETRLAKFTWEKLCFRSESLIVGKIKYVGVAKKFDDR